MQWDFTSSPLERLVVSEWLQLTDTLISNAPVALLLSQPAGRIKERTDLMLPTKELRDLETFIRQKADRRYCLTIWSKDGKAKVSRGDSAEQLPALLPWCNPGPMGRAALPPSMGWREREGWVCHRRSRTGSISIGRRWLRDGRVPGQSKTPVEVTQRRGERREKENCLHGCSAGEGRGGNGQETSARGTERGRLLQLTSWEQWKQASRRGRLPSWCCVLCSSLAGSSHLWD